MPHAELRRELAPFLAVLAGSRADGEDLEQEVWLQAAERSAGAGLPRDLGGWLRARAVRAALTARRAAAREVPVPRPPVARRGPHEELLAAELGRAVRRALGRLSGRCPELLLSLAESPELRYTELAARTGIPRGSIGPTRSRCLACLRSLLAARRADPSGE
ncbi:RNA polymerase sigma factor [Streptomyces sp. NRRL B-24484]|uniref:RNA polymerase sigma factor n=1 Tax=Streptomyces sp. NRRL B-24484 TaxID=1463833 RepID=UPI0009976527|nr:sigma-70 family RNA polymerase sigma factor [Streptomyces sp. NRRL B-24484]